MEPAISENDPSLAKRLTGHRNEVTGLSFHPDCMQLASSSTDSTVILWNLKKHAHAIKYEKHTDHVTDVHFLPNGKYLASSSKDRTVRLWKPSIKTKSKAIPAHTSAVNSIHASADSTVLLSASNDKNIKMWMTEYNNKFVSTFKGHTHWVNCARFSIDGKYVISCSEDKTTKLWDRHTNCPTHTFEEKVIPKYVEFHPNNKCIGVAFSNGHIKIYDIRNHRLIQFYSVHKQCVNKLAIHPSGNFFMSASNDGLIKVYDIIEGRVIYTLEGHDGAVTAVAFSPDGNSFATAGADKTVLVWNTNFHKEILAKPLEKCNVQTKSNEIILERKSRTVDARLSFSGMEQPEIDDSIVQDSPTEEKCSGINSTSDDTFHSMNGDGNDSLPDDKRERRFNSVQSVNSTIHSLNPDSPANAGGDGPTQNDDTVLENIKHKVQALKVDVKALQNQLAEVLETLEKVEKRQVT